MLDLTTLLLSLRCQMINSRVAVFPRYLTRRPLGPLTKLHLPDNLSRMHRIFLLILSLIFFVSGSLLLWEAKLLGFPDGHIADVDRVLLPYDLLVASGLIAFGFWTLVCAVKSPVNLLEKSWWSGCACLVIVILARWPYEAYLATFLMTSAGG